MTKKTEKKEIENIDTGLTSIQEQCAALLASGRSVTEVAETLGVSRGSIYRWRGSSEFFQYERQLKEDLKMQVENKIAALHSQAFQSIKECLISANDAVRLKAAVWIIERISQQDITPFGW